MRQVRFFQRRKLSQYTVAMDKVRLGRALGYGARHAAKTLAKVVDAASAPGVAGTSAAAPRAANPEAPRPMAEATRTVMEAHQAVQQARSQVRGAAKTAGRSVLAPVAKFSSVLWLEVTGTFFTLIALFVGQGAWKLRSAFRLSPATHEAQRLYLHTAVFLLFVYFAVSSFLRARRRQRR